MNGDQAELMNEYKRAADFYQANKDDESLWEEATTRFPPGTFQRTFAAAKLNEVRTTSSSGGQKGVKPERYDLIPILPMDELARVYSFGAQKYADHNWRKGYEWGKSYAAAMRHLTEWWSGTDTDPDSGLHPLAHAAFHLFSLLEWDLSEKYDHFDDRYKS